MSKKQIIVITGADGTGKSTLIKHLINEKGGREVSIWDAFNQNIFNSKKDIDKYLTSLSSNARLLFLSHALMQSIDMAVHAKQHTLWVNGYFYKYFASEKELGADAHLLNTLEKFFPKPNKVIHLQLSPKIAFKRKQKLTQYECGGKPKTMFNFIEFQNKIINHINNYANPTWVNISSELDEKIILKKALQNI